MDNSNLKILIVDDVPKNIQIVGNILQEKNYDIYFANSGKSAIKQTHNNDFDLILLDIMMPEMDGYQVCIEIKKNEQTKNIPIIFLTAKTDTESTIKAFDIGGVDYITKPFNGAELLARVNTHLSLRSAYKEINQANNKLKIEINERKKVEENLAELNATKDKFFSIIAHDLKNPFNTLIGFSELLVSAYEQLPQEKIFHFHKLIYQAAKHGFTLLENLLEWSRSQTGRIKWLPTVIDLKKITSTTFDLQNSVAKNKNITLSIEVKSECKAFADSNMISTVIRNLISNAIKYTPKNGKIKVVISENKEFCIVEIIDSGVGINQKDLNKLFKIDVHYSKEGTNKEKGTGLGLILCKEFIIKNNGEIYAKSELNKGSTFGFYLPKYEKQLD